MIRVMLADDHQILREGIRRGFEAAGDDVVAEASDGEEATRLAREHVPDVVVMDLSMRGMDVTEACRYVKANPAYAHTKILAIAGHLTEDLSSRIVASGTDVVMTKPLNIDKLRTEMARLLGQRAYQPEEAYA